MEFYVLASKLNGDILEVATLNRQMHIMYPGTTIEIQKLNSRMIEPDTRTGSYKMSIERGGADEDLFWNRISDTRENVASKPSNGVPFLVGTYKISGGFRNHRI